MALIVYCYSLHSAENDSLPKIVFAKQLYMYVCVCVYISNTYITQYIYEGLK